MSVSFSLDDYKLTCHTQEGSLALRLEPLKVENRSVTHYLYEAEYRDPHLPEVIKSLFNQSTNDWYRYIEFHREKCFELNHHMIRRDQESEPNEEGQYTQLPIVFKMKLMEGIKESKFKLYGSKELFSKELKLQRLLALKENVIIDLKKTLSEKNSIIEELKSALTHSNQQNQELRQENSRLLQQQLPRKKLHINQDLQQGTMSQQMNNFPFSPNQESNSSNKSKKNQARNPQSYEIPAENISMQNQPSSSNPAFSEQIQQNDINERKINQIPQRDSQKHSETFYNRPSRIDSQQAEISSRTNEVPTSNLNSMSATFQNRRQLEEERKDEKPVLNGYNQSNQMNINSVQYNQNQVQKPIQTVEKQQSTTVQQPPQPKIIVLNGQVLNEDKIRMVKEFVSKKCHMEVGIDENNNTKFGYCCIFCQKVFKQDEFLSKHLFSRHTEINNETSIDFLMNVFNNFKRRRDQKILAFENQHAMERRLANRAQILQGRQ